MDYSISWEYIVNKMKEKGIDPDSTELHEMGFFRRKLDEIWTDFYFETKMKENQGR